MRARSWRAALGALALAAVLAAAAAGGDDANCDLVAERGVCLFGGQKVLVPDAAPNGLVGHWSFDGVKPLDSSGQRNHGAAAIPPGPGVGSSGASAMFNGRDSVKVPHAQSLTAPSYSVSMWVYLRRMPEGADTKPARNCPLLYKGDDGNHPAPSLEVNTRSRELRFVVETDSDKFPSGEFAASAARLPLRRWTHIAVVHGHHSLQLWVNGILDAKNVTEGASVFNKGALHLGGVPWLADKCGVELYVDEVRYFSRALTADEIQAEGEPALGGIEPSFLHLACKSCTLKAAATGCREGYHVCTVMELHTGGYQVARLMGWASRTTHVWSHAAVAGDEADPAHTLNKGKAQGLGICCSDQR